MEVSPKNGAATVKNLGKKNIVLGKNGCGKSHLLKGMEIALRAKQPATVGVVKYLSPERGGSLSYEPAIEQQITNDDNHLASSRRRNQADRFRQQSAALYRQLEVTTLREIVENPELRRGTSSFQDVVDRLNSLLDRIEIHPTKKSTFEIREKGGSKQALAPDVISSGEAELISLGREFLAFEKECVPSKQNFLLIDEPDVHLHPDLQARLAGFLNTLADDDALNIVVATHSTAFLGAMAMDGGARVGFMRQGDQELVFSPISHIHKRILPIFGAHPLSNIFNESPILLVEGDDDERIWQQAVRSAGGRLRLYPCPVGSVNQLADFEREVRAVIEAIYDDAVGYSLRDGDLKTEPLDDHGAIRRLRLCCRSAENLLLSDELLARQGISWPTLESRIDEWLQNNTTHPHHSAMQAFADNGFDRVNSDLKAVRNDLTGLLDSNKAWETLVGQTLASITGLPANTTPTSILSMLGERVVSEVLGLS